MGKPSLTRGFAQVPNNFVENLALLIPAEVALALLLFRRGGNSFAAGGVDVDISDETWERWTGFKARQKEYAIAGLKEKCLSVEGRGNKTRFFFEPDRWKAYVTEKRAEVDAEIRTKGRTKVAAVKSKPGMMVHPECASGGCQNLCGEGEKPKPCLVPVPAVPANPKPAAKPPSKPMAPAAETGRELVSAPTGTNRNLTRWPQTISAVRGIFPTAGNDFFVNLVARSRNVAPQLTDHALAAAVRICWDAKKGVQKREGLFLSSVPAFLESNRSSFRGAPSSPAPVKYKCVSCSDTGYEMFGAPIDSDEPFITKPCRNGCRPPAVGALA